MLLATHELVGHTSLDLLMMQPVLDSLLVITNIVIHATQPVPCNYGMTSNVKEPAALVPTLPHGLVYSFLLQ